VKAFEGGREKKGPCEFYQDAGPGPGSWIGSWEFSYRMKVRGGGDAARSLLGRCGAPLFCEVALLPQLEVGGGSPKPFSFLAHKMKRPARKKKYPLPTARRRGGDALDGGEGGHRYKQLEKRTVGKNRGGEKISVLLGKSRHFGGKVTPFMVGKGSSIREKGET